jgi:hypothetical protein
LELPVATPDGALIPKFIEAVKDLPAWLLSAFAAACAMLVFFPASWTELAPAYRPAAICALIVFGTLAIFKWVAVAATVFRQYRKDVKAGKRIHPTVKAGWWGIHKQDDGTYITQFTVDLAIKNISDTSVGLMGARVIKPRIKGQVVSNSVMTRHQTLEVHGTPVGRNYRCEPGTVTPARVAIMIRAQAPYDHQQDLTITLALVDDEGREQRVRAVCKGHPKSPTKATLPKKESQHDIADPIEKQIVAVLQSEASRYALNNRKSGGLGSIHIVYRGQALHSFASDPFVLNTPINQLLIMDPDAAVIASDNLAALESLYLRLDSDDARRRFLNALTNRVRQDGEYAKVAYFIAAVLWRTKNLDLGLSAISCNLDEDDRSSFGVGNALMLLNGLLRYRHTEFTELELDAIERFIQPMEGGVFHIPDKIAAIRALRLLDEAREDAS